MNIAWRKREIYSSIHELTLDRWVKIYESGDLKHLIKSGKFTDKELSETWATVIEQYMSISKDAKSDLQTTLYKRVQTLNIKLLHIDKVVEMMKIYAALPHWTDEVLQQFERTKAHIHQLGFFFKFENILADLEKLDVRKQSMVIELRGLEKQYIELNASTDHSKMTAYDFDEQITELAKFQGHAIPKETTTVSTYLAILNRFKQSIKSQQEALSKYAK